MPHFHVFAIENKTAVAQQFGEACRIYAERWGQAPAAVVVREGTAVPDEALAVEVQTWPLAGCWYFAAADPAARSDNGQEA